MPTRKEVAPTFIEVPTPQNLSSKEMIHNSTNELADFLSQAPIDSISVESVIPSTKIGIMYSLYVGRKIGVNDEGAPVFQMLRTNNASVEILQNALALNRQEDKGKKHKRRNSLKRMEKVLDRNLKLIEEVISEPTYWKNPHNARIDN